MSDVYAYRVTGTALLIGCALFSAPAAGQATPQVERAAAEVMFEAGREAMAAGNFDLACEKFEASMKLDPAPGTLMNLGNCEERRGRVASAWERYIAAQRELPETDRRKAFAAKKVKELEPLVPHATIVLADDAPEDTQVHREGIDLTGSLGVRLPLDPGTHRIVAVAPGYAEQTFELELELRSSARLVVEPGEKHPEPPEELGPTTTPAEEPVLWGPLTQRQWAFVAGGVGLAGILTAFTTGALAYGEMQTMNEECDPGTRLCSPAGIAARDTGDRLATIANVAGVIGVLGLGGGVYLYFADFDSSDPAPSGSGKSTSRSGWASTRLELGSFETHRGVRLSGQF